MSPIDEQDIADARRIEAFGRVFSWLFGILAVAAGASATIALSSATQVWVYPYARSLLLRIWSGSAMAALAWAATGYALRVIPHYGVWGRSAFIAGAFFAGAGGLYQSAIAFNDALKLLSNCAHPQRWICNLSLDKATPDQLEQLNRALQKPPIICWPPWCLPMPWRSTSPAAHNVSRPNISANTSARLSP